VTGDRVPRVLVVGEAIVDLLPPQSLPGSGSMRLTARFGGSPANAAVGLARLQVPVGFAGRLARRGYGPWLRAHLEAEQVDLSASVDADESCTLAVVTLDAAGVASYEFYGPDTADWAWTAAELPDPVGLARSTVHTGSIATGIAPGAAVLTDWLRRLRRQGDVAISYDPNIRPTLLGDVDLVRQVLTPALACAHLVKVSEEDLDVLYPGVTIDEVVKGWLADDTVGAGGFRAGPELVVVTVGSEGAVAWHRDGRRIQRSLPPVDVVDTVGAGDAFTAGLLSCLHEQGALTPARLAAIASSDVEAAIDRANRVASITCTRVGADPPRLDELT
jgi:fructokinase